MFRRLLGLQALILGGGVVFAWTNVAMQVRTFVDLYGTIFRFRDCVTPNPLTTACFFGAVALFIAFIWSLVLLQNFNSTRQRFLRYFLLFGTLFALSVLGYEFLEYYHIFTLTDVAVSCSPGVFPLRTPCFFGALFFSGALVTSVIISRSHMTVPAPSETDAR